MGKGFIDSNPADPSLEAPLAPELVNTFEDLKAEHLEIETRGPVKVSGHIEVGDLALRLTGKSEADLSGTASHLDARVEFASKLRAYELTTDHAEVDVSGASSAKVHVTKTLEMDEGAVSDIDYRGSPEILRHY